MEKVVPRFLFAIFFPIISCVISTEDISNGIADTQIIHQEISSAEFVPECTLHGKQLDLLFVLDSSSSLKSKFKDELNVIREIVNIVAIGEHSTRVALIQFSGTQRTVLHFNSTYKRQDILKTLDALRDVSGITKTGAALRYAAQELDPAYGMRGRNVPKLIFLLSDGRTHDYPQDKIWADKLRELVPGLDIWAYGKILQSNPHMHRLTEDVLGTGDYVAMGELVNITRDETKIVTKKNLHRVAELFEEYRATEVCEQVPACIPGSDKPLDLMIVFDASRSLTYRFWEQVNFVRRVVNSIHIHPQAVRLSLITYSGTVILNFDFNRFHNNQDVLQYLYSIRAFNGTTRTQLALRKAFDTFEPEFGNPQPPRKSSSEITTENTNF